MVTFESMPVSFTPVSATIGGLLIGSSTALVLLMNGKIAGISGVVARLFNRVPGDTAWRAVFLIGLIAGGACGVFLVPSGEAYFSTAGLPRLLTAGLLVGLGTRIGGGCTSGHGVCGIGRGSRSSIVATLIFVGVAMGTVYVLLHVATSEIGGTS